MSRRLKTTESVKTWKDYPRTTDKVAIVGFHEATRDNAPWDNPEYEIWTVNEEYNFDWIKRTDRHFQMHPRWDFSRSNNNNDPNHFLWLKNKADKCIRCKGTKAFEAVNPETKQKETLTCNLCDENGIYHPEQHRRGKMPIYMQKTHKDIPNSIAFPLEEAWKTFQPGERPYFMSSCSFQLALAMLMGFKRIEFYGYDMGTLTEYHYQKANFEYWLGLAHGHGFDVALPGSQILTGELYGYRSMKTGFRQQLEMRKFNLNKQFEDTKIACVKLEAQTALLNALRKELPVLEEKYKETKLKLAHLEGILNFINGAKTETENLTGLYSGYFQAGTESGADGEVAQAYSENDQFVTALYVEKENA